MTICTFFRISTSLSSLINPCVIIWLSPLRFWFALLRSAEILSGGQQLISLWLRALGCVLNNWFFVRKLFIFYRSAFLKNRANKSHACIHSRNSQMTKLWETYFTTPTIQTVYAVYIAFYICILLNAILRKFLQFNCPSSNLFRCSQLVLGSPRIAYGKNIISY